MFTLKPIQNTAYFAAPKSLWVVFQNTYLLFVIFGQQISILRTFRPCTISSYSDIPPDCLKHCLDTGKDTDLKMDIAQEKGHFMICTP